MYPLSINTCRCNASPDSRCRSDWIGAALFTASSTVFLFGITAGGVLWPWGSYQILLPLLLGAIALVGFGFYEVRLAVEPLIDPRIFQNSDIILTYVMTILHGAILWALVYFLSTPLAPPSPSAAASC